MQGEAVVGADEHLVSVRVRVRVRFRVRVRLRVRVRGGASCGVWQ